MKITMGVMSKLLESNQSATAADPAADAQPAPQPTWPASWRDPAPCRTCGCPAFWVDVYSGGPHCRKCNNPSSPSLVAIHAWVLDTELGFEWVRDPRRGAQPASVDNDRDNDDLVAWQVRSGVHVIAAFERVDHRRVAGPGGRYDPPLACGPVGDLTFDEWWKRLSDVPG